MRENERLELLEIARETALAAGRFLAGSDESTVIENQRRDVKLDVDRKAEELIIERLHRQSTFPVLTEERGWVGGTPPVHGLRWIVDPLDGTVNFQRGIPLSCVSIALWDDDRPLLGAIHNFIDSETFCGVVDNGAWLRNTPIRVSNIERVQDSILFTGFPVGGDFSATAVQEFVSQVVRYKKIRSIGSAALALAYVAAGRGDLYFERDVKLWDVAAGLAIVSAAGGSIKLQSSSKPNCITAWAGNAFLQNHLV